ncbi:MAG TPA: polynucleotide adenylyltransferase, partial [Myxococcota bacterium]|nr:polynucleotide adenylyltransferase [Myxococcota bacterium]
AMCVQDAAEALHRRRINAAPLSRGRGKATRYVGLVNRQDLDAAMRHGYGDRPVLEFSGQEPAWVPADAPLATVRHALVAGPRRLVLVGTPPVAEGVLTRGLVLRASPPPATAGQRRPPQPSNVLGMARKHLGALWPLLEATARVATERGVALYLVGGTVRDLFLGIPGRDVDVVVEGDAPELARAAARVLGGEVSIPGGFGTARWYPPDHPAMDLASARSEYYEAPGALPKVEHASLNQDLFRRDFTVNAMALALSGPGAGRIYDPYGGYTDLRAGVLRVLHGLSFYDDPTRAWRAVRFAARFEFTLAPDTEGLLKGAVRAGVMEKLSLERLGSEVELLLGEREVVQAFRLVKAWGLAPTLHPELHINRALLARLGDAQ